VAVRTNGVDLDLFVSTTNARRLTLAQTLSLAVLQMQPAVRVIGALTDHVCHFNLVQTSSPAKAAVNAPLVHHAEADTVVRSSSRPTLITVAWRPTQRTVPMVNSVFPDNAAHSTLLPGLLPIVAHLMESANPDLTARTTSAYLSGSQPTYRNVEAAQNPAEVTKCVSRVNVSATLFTSPTHPGSLVVLGLEVLEHVFLVQMRMKKDSRTQEAVPREEAAVLAKVNRMKTAREKMVVMPTAKKEDLLMEMDHQTRTMMRPATGIHSHQMVPTMEATLAMRAHQMEMAQPQLDPRELRAMLGKGEETQLLEVKTTQADLREVLLCLARSLTQETGMDKQTKMDLTKMAPMKHHQGRTEEILALAHLLQLAAQPVLGIPSVSTTNALQFRTHLPAGHPPAVFCVFFGDKRHQHASQGLPVLTTSAYRPMARSTAVHQVSIAPSTMLVYKIPVWLSVTQPLAVVKLAAAMKSV
jgi:hypothetical protein